MTDDNPYRTRAARTGRDFTVIIEGTEANGSATRATIARVATESAAFKRLVEVLLQWEASHGAIRPGTRVSIVHVPDGGKVFSMEYLGYQETLI